MGQKEMQAITMYLVASLHVPKKFDNTENKKKKNTSMNRLNIRQNET